MRRRERRGASSSITACRGRYYVVDRLFAAAELRLGERRQQVVRISRGCERGARRRGGGRHERRAARSAPAAPPKVDPETLVLRGRPAGSSASGAA